MDITARPEWFRQTKASAPPADKPKRPSPGPVLLGDCVCAADHTTLLLALWRRWDDPDA